MGKLTKAAFGLDDDGCGVEFSGFSAALNVWVYCQTNASPTVRAAAETFNVTDETIREAVEDQYWLFLSGPDDDPTKQTIEMDGE